MRASLENFGIFTFLNCYFFQYFVGTADTLSVQMTCLSAYMYRQISKCTDKNPKKHYWGAAAPPAPPLATLMGPIGIQQKHADGPIEIQQVLSVGPVENQQKVYVVIGPIE